VQFVRKPTRLANASLAANCGVTATKLEMSYNYPCSRITARPGPDLLGISHIEKPGIDLLERLQCCTAPKFPENVLLEPVSGGLCARGLQHEKW
jgi:hypothetical protein